MIGVATQRRPLGGLVDADLDTLATTRYVTIDDLVLAAPDLAPPRPPVGIAPPSATPNWSPWPSCRLCSASPLRPVGCAMPTATCATCSRTCPARAATTSACVARGCCCATPSERSPPTPPCGPTTSGSSTPPQWNAAARGRL